MNIDNAFENYWVERIRNGAEAIREAGVEGHRIGLVWVLLFFVLLRSMSTCW